MAVTSYERLLSLTGVEIVEIMPQYAGGVQALLFSEKKNSFTHCNPEECEDVIVKNRIYGKLR